MTTVRPADEDRITVATTIRLLFRPESEANLISQRIAKGEPFLSDRAKRIGDSLITWSTITVLPIAVFVFLLLPTMWLFSAVFMAAISAILTLRELQQGVLEQVALTTLADCDIVKGLAGGVLLRMDGWRQSVTTALPFIVIGIGLFFSIDLFGPSEWMMGLLVLAIWIMLTVGIVGANILGVVAGLWLALRNRTLSSAAAGVALMIVYLVTALIGFVAASRVVVVASLAAILLMVLPFLLATFILNQSTHWLRKTA